MIFFLRPRLRDTHDSGGNVGGPLFPEHYFKKAKEQIASLPKEVLHQQFGDIKEEVKREEKRLTLEPRIEEIRRSIDDNWEKLNSKDEWN